MALILAPLHLNFKTYNLKKKDSKDNECNNPDYTI
jgi:hypothetical protein